MGFLSFLGSLVSGILGSSSQSKANETNLQIARETNAQNYKIYQEQKEFEQQMWHEQNAYNSPLQQMQRLREAGLNENLVYNGGAAVGNSTSSYPQVSSPTMQAPHVTAVDNPIALAIQQYMAMEMQTAQLDAIKLKNDQQAIENDYLRFALPIKKHQTRFDDENFEANRSVEAATKGAQMQSAIAKSSMDTIAQAVEEDLAADGIQVKIRRDQAKTVTENLKGIVLTNDIKTIEKSIKQLDQYMYEEFGLRPHDPGYMKLVMQFLYRFFGAQGPGYGVIDKIINFLNTD